MGLEIASKRGFEQSFSAYIAWLIRRDGEGGVTREDVPRPKGTKGIKGTKAAPVAAIKPKRGRKPATPAAKASRGRKKS